MTKPLTIEELIERGCKKHKGKYLYVGIFRKNKQTYGIMICYKHGRFEQGTDSHLNRGLGCNKCGIEKRAKESLASQEEWYKNLTKSERRKYDA